MQELSRFMFECKRIFIRAHCSATYVWKAKSVEGNLHQIDSSSVCFITQNNCKYCGFLSRIKYFSALSQWYRYVGRSDQQLQSQSPLNMEIGNVDFSFICRCSPQLTRWFIIIIECGLSVSCSMFLLVCTPAIRVPTFDYWDSNDAFSWNESHTTAPGHIL